MTKEEYFKLNSLAVMACHFSAVAFCLYAGGEKEKVIKLHYPLFTFKTIQDWHDFFKEYNTRIDDFREVLYREDETIYERAINRKETAHLGAFNATTINKRRKPFLTLDEAYCACEEADRVDEPSYVIENVIV